ncbi:F-box/LRR-repeat protein At2g29930-like [Papaver somniferum]|uniref:F-box/LRR-repeat protein At2g29930-like n=1 Tax=Papaver somniferum TaxID=3469 RepID=UPI000E700BC4|nr:F-box/LRR-repeat protein At2g29930-like [Papaver somniferum]
MESHLDYGPTLEFADTLYNYIPTSSETREIHGFCRWNIAWRNSSNVDKFSLLCNHHLNENRLHSWISTVVSGNVKELQLSLRQKRPLFIPLSLFTCESLISLNLITHPDVRLPKYISFPRLKRLALYGFEFSDESWNEELFSNSPVLEELILRSCTYNMRNFCISIPTLKHLEIGTWRDKENGFRDRVFEIDAPRLVTFSYYGYGAKEFVLSNFLALDQATVYFNYQNKVGAQATSRLLRALAHVKCLTVYNQTLKAICSSYDLPTFHGVKVLKISDSITTDEGLIALVKAVPNLESVVFVQYMYDNEEVDVADAVKSDSNDSGEDKHDKEDDSWALDCMTTGCLFPHLKSVCFQWFVGNPREMRWVKLILRNAKALQLRTIRYHASFCFRFIDVKSEEKLRIEMPSFPRASRQVV